MTQVTLVPYEDNLKLAEIFQSLDIKFAFVTGNSPEFKQITMPAKCRDFLGDCIFSRVKNRAVGIWGFNYNYKKNPYDLDAVKLSLKFPEGKEAINIFKEKAEAFLHEKEKQAGITQLTKVYETNDKKTLVVVGDKSWQDSPWRLSLYTFYLKVASYESEKLLEHPENNYIGYLTKPVESSLLKHVTDGKAFFFDSLNSNHDCAGFVSTISGDNTKEHKYLLEGN
jgi:hypothetical protein